MALIKDKIKQQNKEEYAYKKMLSYGWTPDQAAGIVGNLKYESGFNTSAEGDIGYKGGSSFGIAQFRGKRLDNLRQMYGSNWKDLDNQLDFVNWELNNTHKKVGDRLRNTQGIYNTGALISDKYEIPAKKFHQNKDRQKAVFSVYEKYSGVPLTDSDQQQFLKGTAQRAVDSHSPQQETVNQTLPIYSPEVINFVEPIKIDNLAESNETQAVQKAKEELDYKQQQQINQQRFIQDLLAASQVQYIDPNQVQQEDIYNQEQFYQRGGRMVTTDPYLTVKDNIPILNTPVLPLDDAKNFTIDYIQSPKYRERLINSGYKNVDNIISQRLSRMSKIQNVSQYGAPSYLEKKYYDYTDRKYNPEGGSAYLPSSNVIIDDQITDKKIPGFIGMGKSGVRAHELGHAEISKIPLNDKDYNSLNDRLILANDNTTPLTGQMIHDLDPRENKADINALRFLLKEQGIYDAGKENFTKEHLKKLKPNFVKNRLLNNYKEEDLIWLMNNVAQNENEDNLTYGQNGGKIYNPNLSLNKDFQDWYIKNTIEGKNNIPYSDKLDYDYLSFFKNKKHLNYEGGHFPDTYKRPNHQTFSNESVYSIPENPGGFWIGEDYNKNGKFLYKRGGIVVDDQGYWNPDNWGKVVEINSNNITMEGVMEPLLGVSNETGERKLMIPGKNYIFENTQKVTEYPIKRTKSKRFS